jgi:1A family penicillin-binding protein
MEKMYGRRFRLRKRLKIRLPANWGKWLFIALIGGVVLMVAIFFWFSRDLPDPNTVQRKSGYSTSIYDRTGEVDLYDVYVDENRKFTPLSEIPDYLKQATVAIEDKDFYKHSGFDPLAFLRIFKNMVTRQRVIGGSTLTQQLVKNVLLTNERSVSRKIREFVLAIRIERQFTKDEILQMYLNEAPYGGNTLGVEAAAKTYFGKEPKDLSLVESVVLAGMPQSPSRFSPYGSNPLAYVSRAKDVVRRMREDGYLSVDQEKEVVENLTSVSFMKQGKNIKAPHFVMYVKEKLEEMYGPELVEQGGLKVTTTLDWERQEEAEKIVMEEIDKVAEKLLISNGATVVVDPKNGEILSMVGSKDFFDENIDGEVNVVTRLRQPGSSIKPLVYAVALGKGYTPASVLMDSVTQFPGKDEQTPYEPQNYDGKEHGLLHLREALASSINVPAVKLVALVGVKSVLEQGYKMGLTSLEPTKENLSRLGLSMALGGGEIKLLEMTTAYSAFANGGQKVNPVAILKVEDKNGKVIFEYKQTKQEKVLDEKVAFLITSMLSDNNARLLTFGPNSYLNLGSRAVAVKTGTTNDLRDNWTVGWSRDVMVGVWVGNNDNSQMKNVASGVSGAAPIWRRIMLSFLTKYPDKPFDVPGGVVQVEVDKVSGYPAHDGFTSYKEWIIEGTLPTGDDPIHKKIKVCKGQTDRLATEVRIAEGDYETREIIEIKEKDPLTDKSLWQAAIDRYLATMTDSIYKIPREYCDQSNGVVVTIVSPGNESRVDGEEVTIKFELASGKTIRWADLYLDGNMEQRFTSKPYQKIYRLSKGNHKVKIVAQNEDGVEGSREVEFGIGQDFLKATPTPMVTPSLSATPVASSSGN